MKKLLVVLSLVATFPLSLIAFEESFEESLIDRIMLMSDDIPEEVKELAMMYRGLEMDIEDIEDEIADVSSEIQELKEMVQELTDTCKQIKKEVSKR